MHQRWLRENMKPAEERKIWFFTKRGNKETQITAISILNTFTKNTGDECETYECAAHQNLRLCSDWLAV